MIRQNRRLLLFDTGLGAENSMLPVAMESMGVQSEDIDFLFLTHLHGNHIGEHTSRTAIRLRLLSIAGMLLSKK